MDLQSIATEARNRKSSGMGIFQIIGIIIFVVPIVIHGFKWGWAYPILGFFFATISVVFTALLTNEVFGSEALIIIAMIFAVIFIAIPIFAGSVLLCVLRFRKMCAERERNNMPELHTPPTMRDHD